MKVVGVPIIDDSDFIRHRVMDLFADQDGIQIVGEVSTGLEAIHKVSELEQRAVVLNRESTRDSQSDELSLSCVAVAFASIAQNIRKNVLAVVLTGKVGAQKLKARGASILAQDESSCTVCGMPKAIIDANLADRVLNMGALADPLASL